MLGSKITRVAGSTISVRKLKKDALLRAEIWGKAGTGPCGKPEEECWRQTDGWCKIPRQECPWCVWGRPQRDLNWVSNGSENRKGNWGRDPGSTLCLTVKTLDFIRSDMRSPWRTWGRTMTSSDLGSKEITEDAGWKVGTRKSSRGESAQRPVEPYSCLCLEEGWWWKCVGDACGEKCLQSVCLFKVELSGLPDLSKTIKWDQAHENVPWALGCKKSHLLCLFIWWGHNSLRNHVWSLQTYFY